MCINDPNLEIYGSLEIHQISRPQPSLQLFQKVCWFGQQHAHDCL